MFTTTSLKTRIFAALSLCAVLACGAAFANDSYQETMRDAIARNDTQLLDDTGGPTFLGRSASVSALNPTAHRSVMQDAYARNDAQLLPDDFSGGATFLRHGSGNAGNQNAYLSTMRNAFERHDTRILPESYAGGASFTN